MTQGMKHLPYEDRLRELQLQPGEKKAPGRPDCGLSESEGGCKKETDSLAQSVRTGQGEMISKMRSVKS